MWNYLHGAWLMDAKVLLYDGSSGYPEVDFLWKLAEKFKINHFGNQCPIYHGEKKRLDLHLEKSMICHYLSLLVQPDRPCHLEGFDYVYESIKQDVWLC